MGLFHIHDRTSAIARPGARARVRLPVDLMQRMGCKACPLDRMEDKLRHPKMLPTGAAHPYIYVLGEAPGVEEDKEGEQFIGKSGDVIRTELRKALKLRKDDDENKWVRWNNTIRCHPDRNRDPEPNELTCCMPKQWKDMEQAKPRVVLALGKYALQSMIDEQKISAWRGRKLSLVMDGHVCWLVPTFHPSFILRSESSGGHTKQDRQQQDQRRFFVDDLNLAVELAEENQPPTYTVTKEQLLADTQLVTRADDIVKMLNKVRWTSYGCTDIETTHLRPYHNDAAILTAALSNGKMTYAFPIAHPEAGFTAKQQQVILEAYAAALQRCDEVWAHNLNFEMEWLAWQFGHAFVYKLNGHDTMAQGYVLDERSDKGVLSLEGLCVTYLGLRIKDMYVLDKENMRTEPLDKVLPYNAVDAKTCSLIAPIQAERLKLNCQDAVYEMLRKVSPAIAITQNLGVVPDTDEADRLYAHYKTLEDKAKADLLTDPDVVEYSKKREFAPNAPASVSKFFVSLGYHDLASTSDEAALKGVDHPVAQNLMLMREYGKLRTTYVAPLCKQGAHARGKHIFEDGLVHTQFNHLLTSTGRLCVAKGTMVRLTDCMVPIELIEKMKRKVLAFTNDKQIDERHILDAGKTGTIKQRCVRVAVNRFGYEHAVIVTPDHRIRVPSPTEYATAYMRADALKPGQRVLVEPKHAGREFARTPTGIVMSVKDAGFHEVYDLVVQMERNFFANGICVHNSSQDPNMQNLPIREHPEVRVIIKALTDHWIVSCDYGQIEARVIGMASRDKKFCQALREDYDVHMEWAQRIAAQVPRVVGGKAGLKDKDVMKKFRSLVKNKWTFPLFFLAGLPSVALSLECDERELRGLFEDFWTEFNGVHNWQKEILKFYEQHGYVETLTGRRRHGPMTVNMQVNSPIQGTASDIVVDAMKRLSLRAINTGHPELHPRLNVHDDLTLYLPDEHLEENIDIIGREMVTSDFWFINVPLTVEVKVGRNWGKQKEIAVLRTEDYT